MAAVVVSTLAVTLFGLDARGVAVVGDVPVPASFVRFELPAALAFALMLYPMLRGDHRVSKAEGGVLLLAFGAWVAFELLLLR